MLEHVLSGVHAIGTRAISRQPRGARKAASHQLIEWLRKAYQGRKDHRDRADQRARRAHRTTRTSGKTATWRCGREGCAADSDATWNPYCGGRRAH
jgi:hypothetical protein